MLTAGTHTGHFRSRGTGAPDGPSQWRLIVQIRKPTMFRNALDLRDKVQVRILRRRLKISAPELGNIVRKTGNSLSAITKEAAVTRPR
jgi:hypothetical protein